MVMAVLLCSFLRWALTHGHFFIYSSWCPEESHYCFKSDSADGHSWRLLFLKLQVSTDPNGKFTVELNEFLLSLVRCPPCLVVIPWW